MMEKNEFLFRLGFALFATRFVFTDEVELRVIRWRGKLLRFKYTIRALIRFSLLTLFGWCVAFCQLQATPETATANSSCSDMICVFIHNCVVQCALL